MWFFVQFCNRWQDFHWHSASRGLSSTAEVRAIFIRWEKTRFSSILLRLWRTEQLWFLIYNVTHACGLAKSFSLHTKVSRSSAIAEGTSPEISLQRNMISQIGNKLVNLQALPYVNLQFGELWSTNGWEPLTSFCPPHIFRIPRHCQTYRMTWYNRQQATLGKCYVVTRAYSQQNAGRAQAGLCHSSSLNCNGHNWPVYLRVLICVIVPNFVAIGQAFAEMRHFFDLKNYSRPPSSIFKSSKF